MQSNEVNAFNTKKTIAHCEIILFILCIRQCPLFVGSWHTTHRIASHCITLRTALRIACVRLLFHFLWNNNDINDDDDACMLAAMLYVKLHTKCMCIREGERQKTEELSCVYTNMVKHLKWNEFIVFGSSHVFTVVFYHIAVTITFSSFLCSVLNAFSNAVRVSESTYSTDHERVRYRIWCSLQRIFYSETSIFISILTIY